MTETHTTETRLSRTRKAAIAAALVAGLSGAFTIVGISAASSDPGSGTPSTEVEGDSPMDLGDPADCEFSEEGHAMFDEGRAMFDEGRLDHGDMGNMGAMMGAGTRMGA
jgi:hypothetical protein